MKKLISITLILLSVCLLFSCTPKPVGSNDTTLPDTPPVTGPDGFEDVTAPPITTAPDTTKKDDPKDTTDADTTEKSLVISSIDEAVAAARAYKGEFDSDIGYKYAYSYDGMMKDGGVDYYMIRVAWYIEEQEKYSKCGYILVSPDGTCKEYDW